jgi:hypothetical protein
MYVYNINLKSTDFSTESSVLQSRNFQIKDHLTLSVCAYIWLNRNQRKASRNSSYTFLDFEQFFIFGCLLSKKFSQWTQKYLIRNADPLLTQWLTTVANPGLESWPLPLINYQPSVLSGLLSMATGREKITGWNSFSPVMFTHKHYYNPHKWF